MMSTDLKAIARLGPRACAMLLSGTFGIVVGGPLALALFQSWLDPQAWKGLGALAGFWIGGGSNMMAIKEGVNCPSEVFSPVIIVDSVVGYGWMSVMIALSGYQVVVDRWNRADRRVIEELNLRMATYQKENSVPLTLLSFAMMLGIGFVASWCCMWLGRQIPEWGSVFSEFTYGVLCVVFVGLWLSFTPARRLENEGASAVAYGGLYLMTATMGAAGNLYQILEAPLFLAVGVVWVAFHATCLVVAACLLRAPMFLFVTGSQGNIGGVVSTPVVAGVFQPSLAPVGILMGVLGNIVGTPAGLLCAQLMSWVAHAYFGDAADGPPPPPV
ncbi:MAG: hypothetical protein CMJ59_17160 [Planctomycetaceae bacterium]|nr:hypothetical protein [Planctomycetaceae bacterium]